MQVQLRHLGRSHLARVGHGARHLGEHVPQRGQAALDNGLVAGQWGEAGIVLLLHRQRRVVEGRVGQSVAELVAWGDVLRDEVLVVDVDAFGVVV